MAPFISLMHSSEPTGHRRVSGVERCVPQLSSYMSLLSAQHRTQVGPPVTCRCPEHPERSFAALDTVPLPAWNRFASRSYMYPDRNGRVTTSHVPAYHSKYVDTCAFASVTPSRGSCDSERCCACHPSGTVTCHVACSSASLPFESLMHMLNLCLLTVLTGGVACQKRLVPCARAVGRFR
jgi:hypothetical protein